MLNQFLNNGYFNKQGALINLISEYLADKYYSKILLSKLKSKSDLPIANGKSFEFSLPVFEVDNSTVVAIRNYLFKNKHQAIVAAIIHGSIADNTCIPYSDFDGVLIYDEEKLTTSKNIYNLRNLIKDTNLLMRKQDSLQHHGWMLISTKQLKMFDENIFPISIFNESKVIYPKNTLSLKITLLNNNNFNLAFKKLAESILKKIENPNKLNQFYYFKIYISEILLLPATFHQAYFNQSISKRESFNVIKNILKPEFIKILEDIENIRINWNQESVNVYSEILADKFRLLKIVTSIIRSKTPKELQVNFKPEKLSAIKSLISEFNLLLSTK